MKTLKPTTSIFILLTVCLSFFSSPVSIMGGLSYATPVKEEVLLANPIIYKTLKDIKNEAGNYDLHFYAFTGDKQVNDAGLIKKTFVKINGKKEIVLWVYFLQQDSSVIFTVSKDAVSIILLTKLVFEDPTFIPEEKPKKETKKKQLEAEEAYLLNMSVWLKAKEGLEVLLQGKNHMPDLQYSPMVVNKDGYKEMVDTMTQKNFFKWVEEAKKGK